MAGDAQFLISEFNALRAEIGNRTTLTYALIGLELTALGTGLTIVATTPTVVLAVSAVSSFLWMFWCDLAGQIYKIAAYISLDLSPRIEQVGGGVLRWEVFLRRLDQGSTSAAEVLYPHGGDRTGRRTHIQDSTSADWYTCLLFGGTPPVFVGVFLASGGVGRVHDPKSFLVLGGVVLVTGLWLFAIYRFSSFRRTIRTVGEAILNFGTLPPALPAADRSAPRKAVPAGSQTLRE